MKCSSAWLAWGTNCFMTPVSVTVLVWSYIANEWCVETGLSNSTAISTRHAASAEALTVRVLMIPPTPGSLKDVVDGRVQFFLRLIPSLFEVLFPVLRPRAAVVIDEARVG